MVKNFGMPRNFLVKQIALPPDRQSCVAAVGQHARVVIWNATQAARPRLFSAESDGRFSCAAMSSKGELAAVGTETGEIILLDIQSGATTTTLRGSSFSKITSVAFSPDGLRLISGSGRGTLRLWDVMAAEKIYDIEGHSDCIKSVRFSTSGNMIASASKDTTVKIWDAHTGAQLKHLLDHANEVNDAAFSPDSRTLVSVSDDRTLRLWNVMDGSAIRTFRGHKGPVTGVAFVQGGNVIITASKDKSIRSWDVATGEQIQKTSLWGQAASMGVSGDGNTMVLALHSGFMEVKSKVQLWDI